MRCVNTCASTDGARRAQNCALYTSVCFVVSVPLFAMCSRLFMLCVKMYAVCRSQMFVNMRCRIHSLYMKSPSLSYKKTHQQPPPKPSLLQRSAETDFCQALKMESFFTCQGPAKRCRDPRQGVDQPHSSEFQTNPILAALKSKR